MSIPSITISWLDSLGLMHRRTFPGTHQGYVEAGEFKKAKLAEARENAERKKQAEADGELPEIIGAVQVYES
jgi:hypothetical protein